MFGCQKEELDLTSPGTNSPRKSVGVEVAAAAGVSPQCPMWEDPLRCLLLPFGSTSLLHECGLISQLFPEVKRVALGFQPSARHRLAVLPRGGAPDACGGVSWRVALQPSPQPVTRSFLTRCLPLRPVLSAQRKQPLLYEEGSVSLPCPRIGSGSTAFRSTSLTSSSLRDQSLLH